MINWIRVGNHLYAFNCKKSNWSQLWVYSNFHQLLLPGPTWTLWISSNTPVSMQWNTHSPSGLKTIRCRPVYVEYLLGATIILRLRESTGENVLNHGAQIRWALLQELGNTHFAYLIYSWANSTSELGQSSRSEHREVQSLYAYNIMNVKSASISKCLVDWKKDGMIKSQ